ncbi:MAG: hypothetical protein ACI312_04930 [Bacilli bacterium]
MGFLEFLKLNYIWILVVLILLIITIIGFFADRRDKKKKKEKNNLAKNDAPLEVPNIVNIQGGNNISNTVPEMNTNMPTMEQNNIAMPEMNNNTVQNNIMESSNIDNTINLNNNLNNTNMNTNVNTNNNAVNNFEASYGVSINERPNLSTFSSVNITGNNIGQEPVNTMNNVPVEPLVKPQEVNTNQVISGFDMPSMDVKEEVNTNINMPNENIVSHTEVPTMPQSTINENVVENNAMPNVNAMPVYNSWDMPTPNRVQENIPTENTIPVNMPTVENQVEQPVVEDIPTVNEIPTVRQVQKSVPVNNNVVTPVNNIESVEVNQIETPQETANQAPNHPIFAGINFDKPAPSPEAIHMPEGENVNNNIQTNEETNPFKTDDDIWKL